MNLETMLQILDNAIEGRPNSCLSEHILHLTQLRNALATAPDFVADAPRPLPSPARKLYYVNIELSDNYLAEDADDAFDKALEALSPRNGMQIVNHEVGEVT